MHIVIYGFSLYTYNGNKKMKKIIAVIIIVILLSLPVIFLFAAGPGTSAAQFLKLSIGARAVGMGESFTAIADDMSSVFWNPAGLAKIKSTSIHASHTVWFQDINYEFVSVGVPFGQKKNKTLAISANYLYVDGMERRTGNTAEPDGTFGARDMAVTLSYAQAVPFVPHNNLLAGINIKTIRQQIDDIKADAYALDFGMQYKIGQFLSGITVQNIGTKMKFIEKSYPLPLNYKFGIGWQPFGTALNIAVDVNKPNDNKINYHVGTEYWVGDVIALRAGYLHGDAVQRKALTGKGFGRTNNNELISLTGMMAGAGFRIFGYGFDYAFVPYGELGNTHRVSLEIKF